MPDKRSISIGRDANGNLLIAGDQNTIYVLTGIKELSSSVIQQIEKGTLTLAGLDAARAVDKPLIFVSYTRELAEWINVLAAHINEVRSVELWLDSQQIAPGQKWIEEIADALASADGCLVCIGDRFPSSWQKNEIHQSLVIQDEKPNFRIVPIIAPGGSTKFLPAYLKGYQFVDFSDESDFNKLVYEVIAAFVPTQDTASNVVADVHGRVMTIEEAMVEFGQLKTKAKINEKVVIATEMQLANWWLEAKKRHMKE